MAFKRLNMFYENKKQETTEIGSAGLETTASSARAVKVVVGESGNKALFCYLAVWSIYRHGNGMFRTSDLEADLCTHFVYAYLGINETTYEIASIDDWGDNKHENVGMVAKVVDLKKENPNLKVLVSVGGWSEGSIKFSTIAASAGKRRKFIDSVFNYLKAKNLDGIEIAWLIPTMRGGTDEDKANFVTLLEVRLKLS
ncbi:hypothetical protein AAG570_000834 [Ranatra chinensis]|uniref:GH18 domain-containing protein n=1 Tax=Ranatra chinensis TaxID=642074 RepID=A0ABD0YY74_9HEMI